jgi:hypothetical protein
MKPSNSHQQLEPQMLQKMVQEHLTKTDKRAICKIRGFGSAEMQTPALFQNTFQSDMGIEQALNELTYREHCFLHLLARQSSEVNIAFFTTLYPNNSGAYGETFTQQYKETFKQVRENLIRKGVLLWSEMRYGKAQLERYRFFLPQAVRQNLPALLPDSHKLETQSSTSQDGFRHRLISLLKSRSKKAQLSLKDGQLLIGTTSFNLDTLKDWQDQNWNSSLLSKKQSYPSFYSEYDFEQTKTSTPPDIIRYTLSQLSDSHWITPDKLKTYFDLHTFYSHYPSLDEIFDKGWQWGCLERVDRSGQYYYRLQEFAKLDDVNITYLSVKKAYIVIDVEQVPYAALSYLMTISDLSIERGQLAVKPNLVKLSAINPADRQHPLLQWLVNHAKYFAQAYEHVTNDWGKLLVHSNLLYAQVSDLSLRVTLEKAFNKGQVVFLPEGWMAIPINLMSKVETVVRRNGHVIKEVSQND